MNQLNSPTIGRLAFATAVLGSCMLPLHAAPDAGPADCTIHVDAARVVNHITPWMTGACIEDVNHEIYGGLYAQRIYGESFEEPPAVTSPVTGWKVYGGNWSAKNGAVSIGAEAGAKLVRELPVMHDGAVECDIRFADDRGDNAGLILRVQNPRVGADTWSGYEISLSARDHMVMLGRHHDDWHLLATAPVRIAAREWHRLSVRLAGSSIYVSIDNAATPVLSWRDSDPAVVLSGRVGLRTWNSNAAYRNLRIVTPEGTIADSLSDVALETGSGLSALWDPVGPTHSGEYAWDTDEPYNSAHSQRITQGDGSGLAGIANRGLNRWGIPIKEGRQLAGRLYLRQRDYGRPVTVALQSADGVRTYAVKQLAPVGSAWTERRFTLRPRATDPNARFALWIDSPGTVWVDQVTLMGTGEEIFHGLPVRADIAGKMVEEGLTFLRYGGSMVNAPQYRWKNMIGPVDRRPHYRSWNPYASNGFGIEDFLKFCEAAKIEPAFAINIDETPGGAADMVEYLNGAASTPWGHKRAAAGHTKPYRVRYIEIGNEEAIDGNKDWYRRYLERFKLLYDAMHVRDPSVKFVIAAWWRPDEPLVKQIAQELNGKAALWDVHVGGDDLHEGESVDRLFTQMQRLLQEWSPGTNLKACILEENGGRHDLRRALGHAHILNVTERHGDFILMDCPANALQPWQQNDNGWDQGQIFFTAASVWGMPPYYAQQMASHNHLPLRVAGELSPAQGDLDATATRSEEGGTLVIKVVNLGKTARTATLDIANFGDISPDAERWTLSGTDLNAVNLPNRPEGIRSRHDTLHGMRSGFTVTFPAQAYVIIRLRRTGNVRTEERSVPGRKRGKSA